MLKNRFLALVLIMHITAMNAFSLSLSEIQIPKPPSYRVGISAVPENKYIETETIKSIDDNNINKLGDTQNDSADLTYADLSIKNLSKEIAQELLEEEDEMVSDLSLLWQGAATQSDTINFALYKLSNPDADKPDSNAVKKVLKTIASMSTLVGAGIGNPIIAGTSLIGGNMLSIMTQDTKALNYKYTKVTDADMIILVRKVEDLQQNAINLYYDYMSAKKQLQMITKLVEEREHKFELAQKNNVPRELIVINDAYYRTALDKQRSAKSDFFAKRAALEQFVGNETFVQFESELEAREKGESKTASAKESSMSKTTEQENQYSIDEQYEDENLKKLESLTQEDSSEEKLAFLGSKKETSESKTETTVKEPKKKVDRFSTKGFIFVHDTESPIYKHYQPDQRKTKRVSESKKKNEQPAQPEVSPQKSNFLPLDDIKIPELFQNGYSIHEDI